MNQVNLGPVIRMIHQDTAEGVRYVMREHSNGFSCSRLEWLDAEMRWRTVSHKERLFQDQVP